MATTPRYVGMSAAEALAYVTASAGTDWVRLVFDQDCDGVVAPGSSDEDYKILRAPTPAGSNANESAHTHSGTGLT